MRCCLLLLAAATLALSQPPVVTESAKTHADTVKARMQGIEKRLSIKTDEFDGLTTYRPATEWSRVASFYPGIIYPPSKSQVGIIAAADYDGDDWLFMSSLVVLIGSRRFATPPDPSPKRDVLSGSVFECCSWVCSRSIGEREWHGSDSVKNLYRALAEAPADTIVRVRLNGTEGNFDYTMSDAERAAWRDIVFYYDHFEERMSR